MNGQWLPADLKARQLYRGFHIVPDGRLPFDRGYAWWHHHRILSPPGHDGIEIVCRGDIRPVAAELHERFALRLKVHGWACTPTEESD